jgi:hypothetical protein
MSEPTPPPPARPITPLKADLSAPKVDPSTTLRADQMLCERCGAEMYRMHAVWRCSLCGFKTDCCGW